LRWIVDWDCVQQRDQRWNYCWDVHRDRHGNEWESDGYGAGYDRGAIGGGWPPPYTFLA